MDGNKDDALKCIRKATDAINRGDRKDAIKFLEKSIRLYPTKEATDLLKRLHSTSQNNHKGDGNRQASSSNGTSYGTFSNQNRTAKAADSEQQKSEEYTSEQDEAVKRVKKSKDYYEVLGVSKEATSSELKKAYRKLALQLHPDKNKAPGATDAFKAVGKAFGVLNDEEKRKQYDLYGSDEESRGRRRHTYYERYDDGYDVDADEIFRMFFGGGFPSDNVRVFRRGNTYYSYGGRRRSSNSTEHQHQHNETNFSQFLPLILVVVVSILSHMMIKEDPYSLYARGDYKFLRVTKKLSVNYYVKTNFEKTYEESERRRIENSVEAEYVEFLRGNCYNERITKDHLRRKGIYFSNKDFLKKAQEYKTPNCDKLDEIYARP